MRNSGFSWKTLSPRKRLVLLSASSAIIILAVFATMPFGRQKQKGAVAVPKTKEEIVQNLNKDSDGDGLKNWEEKIYGSDPENSDSDGDGALDGEEIKTSRNPLWAGPDDRLSVPLPPPEDGNRTEALANEFMGRSLTEIIAESMSAGKPLSEPAGNQDLQLYVEKLGEERLLDKVIPPEAREFTLNGDNSPQAVKAYFNRIADIYIKHFSPIDSDISVLYLAAAGNNPKAFRRLDANIAAIEKAIKEIKETPVPSKWIGFARDDVWYLSKTLAAVKILRNSESDPVSSLLILRDRVQLLDDIRGFYIDTRTKLAAAGVAFTDGEPASRLLLLQ